jgi:simple sugar transport system substrate-binding protein
LSPLRRRSALNLRLLRALVLLLLALQPSTWLSAQAAKRLRFAVIIHATATASFVPLRKGAEEAGRLVGADVSCAGPAGFDIQKQLEFLKSAIAQNVDGIASTFPDPTAFNSLVKQALAKGIPVIAVNSDAPASGRLAFIGQDDYETGRFIGELVVRYLPGGGSVILGLHTMQDESLTVRIKGLKDVLDSKGGFKYRVVATGTEAGGAEEALAGAVQADPNVKGLFGVDGISGVAAGSLIERQKLKGRICGGGFELTEKTLEHIEKGNLQFTVDPQLYFQGFQAIIALYLDRMFAVHPASINSMASAVTAENLKTIRELASKGYK